MSTTAGEPLSRGLGTLLWELKSAWADATGLNVSVSGLLLDRSELTRFLAEAARDGDARVREIVQEILQVESAGYVRVADGSAPRPTVAEPVSRSAPAAKPAAKGAAPVAALPRREAAVSRADSPTPTRTATAPAESPSPRTGPSAPASPPAAPSAGIFESVQRTAALVAAVLLSLAAGRYLLSDAPAPSPQASFADAPVVSRASLPPPIPDGGGSAAAPAAPPVDPVAALLEADAEVVLRIHGSNTVGESLTPRLVEDFLKQSGATTLATKPGANAEEKQVRAWIPGRERPVAIELHAHGSTTAFTDLAAGSTDIGQSSRRIKPEERQQLLGAHGDLTAPGAEHVAALDGLAIIVHPSNAVRELSVSQVAEIFSGRIRDWTEVGGTAGPMRLYARDDKSGTWDTFKSLVLSPHAVALDPSAKRYESSSQLSDDVAGDPAGIGFIGLAYLRRATAVAVSAEAGGFAILPTAFTVGTEDYPLSRRLYYYTPTTRRSRWMDDFVAFALSQTGQNVVSEVGFVSQNLKTERVAASSKAPTAYRSLTADAERLSVNFRFEPGGEALDNKARRDLDRIVGYLDERRGREVRLFGFTDDLGDDGSNTKLSTRRAQVIEKELLARGIQPGVVKGFGEAMPVADNDSDHGRERNRRVEVWLR